FKIAQRKSYLFPCAERFPAFIYVGGVVAPGNNESVVVAVISDVLPIPLCLRGEFLLDAMFCFLIENFLAVSTVHLATRFKAAADVVKSDVFKTVGLTGNQRACYR